MASSKLINKKLFNQENSIVLDEGSEDETVFQTTRQIKSRKKHLAEDTKPKTVTGQDLPSVGGALDEVSNKTKILKKRRIRRARRRINNKKTDIPGEEIPEESSGRRPMSQSPHNLGEQHQYTQADQKQTLTTSKTEPKPDFNDECHISSTSNDSEILTPRTKQRRKWSILHADEQREFNNSLRDGRLSFVDEKNYEANQIFPSTSGSVSPPKKRRTYELDTTINEISTLKELSKSSCTPLSSSSSAEKEKLFETEQNFAMPKNFSNVTVRTKRYNLRRSDFTATSSVENVSFPTEKVEKSRTPSRLSRSLNAATSTPVAVKRDSLLKSVLTAKVNHSLSAKRFSSPRKMPDFKAIHQKAFDKMEDVVQYKKRKENRAKLLLSGIKPSTSTKLLATKDLPESPETPVNITPPPTILLKEKRQVLSIRSKLPATKDLPETPVNITPPPTILLKEKRQALSIRSIMSPIGNVSKEPLPLRDIKFHIGTSTPAMRKLTPKVRKIDECKQMIKSKGKEIKYQQKNKIHIKGVRSNRRFDLIMAMRKGK